MSEPRPELHMFSRSHFNEKVRWALAWKGIEHRRTSYLPGPHAPVIQRLSGQTATPVLAIEGRVIAGSAAIIDALELRFPERPLYPADPALRAHALAFQSEWDEQVGPAVRTVLFSELIHEPGYVCATFGDDKPAAKRLAYRAAFPLVRGRIARAHQTDDPEAVKRALEITRRALDEVVRRCGASDLLVGDAFSVADLCCAALLAPLVPALPHPDMARPQPVPERLAGFLAQWSEHPAIHWVERQYARHRAGAGARSTERDPRPPA